MSGGGGNQTGGRREEVARRRSARQVAAARDARRRQLLAVVGTAVLVVALVAGFIFLVNRPPAAPDLEVAAPLPAEVAQAGRAMGDPAAPVTVVEWGDFQ